MSRVHCAPCAEPMLPHRGELLLTLALLAVGVLPPVLGPVVWLMARRDLARIRRGAMDPAGLGMTRTAWWCGVGSTVVSAILLAVICLLTGALIYLHWLADSYDVH